MAWQAAGGSTGPGTGEERSGRLNGEGSTSRETRTSEAVAEWAAAYRKLTVFGPCTECVTKRDASSIREGPWLRVL
jgi:hypothetical protein